MSPSVDAVTRLSPDRPAKRSWCLRVSGVVAPSAPMPDKPTSNSPAWPCRTTSRMAWIRLIDKTKFGYPTGGQRSSKFLFIWSMRSTRSLARSRELLIKADEVLARCLGLALDLTSSPRPLGVRYREDCVAEHLLRRSITRDSVE